MDSKRCTSCHAEKQLDQFDKRKKDLKDGSAKAGEPTDVCTACRERSNAKRRELRKRKKTAPKKAAAPLTADSVGAVGSSGAGTKGGVHNAETSAGSPDGGGEDIEELEDAPFGDASAELPAMPLSAFIEHIKNTDAPVRLHARVTVDIGRGPGNTIGSDRTLAERAKEIAETIGDAMLLHWT